ncbi:MAG TPA: response regulator [Nitriliruptorales bacterium]|nr:response regulator [Nitriliruptorales bacterium]
MSAHVLLVEDSATQAAVLRDRLERAGYAVTVKSTGEDALHTLDKTAVDLVVSDVMMPGIDGYELCRRIRTDPRHASIPVLLLTALRDPVDVVRGLEAGADSFITKPFEAGQVIGRVRALLESRRLQAEGDLRVGVDVLFMGQRFAITGERQQILGLLMSTFDDLVHANQRLRDREAELASAEAALANRLREVQAAQDRLDRTLRLAAVGTWELDVDALRIVWWDNVEPLYGVAAGTLSGDLDELLAHVHADDRAAMRELFAGLRHAPDGLDDGRGPRQVEHRIVLPGGEVRWLQLRFSTVPPAADLPLRALGVAMDVSARKQVEGELEQAKVEAESANLAKSEYLSRMSHELRTPLNAVLGFAQLLETADLAREDHDAVAQILRSGRHLLRLIDDVLDISRIEAGRLTLSLEPVDLAAVVADSVELVGPLARQHRIDIERDPSVACHTHVFADRQRLRQVVVNLLTNAIKYNRPDGRVTLSCSSDDQGNVRVHVADIGPGIPADKMPRLFAAFDRLDVDGDATEGTGLGLSLSRHLTEAMGGTIQVRSEIGQGSVFSVELPAARPPELPDDPPPRSLASPSEEVRGTVVHIEDNPSNRVLVERVLTRRPGVTVLNAPEAVTGLALVRERSPDLVLLDLNLPGVPGQEVLRRLRDDPSTRSVPVVVVSADAAAERPDQLLAAGARAYLTKPLNITRLLSLVDTILGADGPT